MAVEDRIGSHYLLLAGTFLPDLEVVMSRSSWIHWSLLAGSLFFVGCGESEKCGDRSRDGVWLCSMVKPVAGAAVSFSPTAKERFGRRGHHRRLGPI